MNRISSPCVGLPSALALLALTATAVCQSEVYLKPSNTLSGSAPSTGSLGFGTSCALSGSTLVVGRVAEDSDAIGINGDGNNLNAPDAGAAYVFMRNGSTWAQQAYLKASNTEPFDAFGDCVAISGDTIVVTAPGEDSLSFGVDGDQHNDGINSQPIGAAYVFVRTGTTWTQEAYLKRPHTAAGQFGLSAAISGDTIVVGASNLACVFVRNGSSWSQQACVSGTFTSLDDDFACSVAISGDTIVVGSCEEDSAATGVNGDQQDNSLTDAGAAFVFRRNGTVWSQEAYLKASNTGQSDSFGRIVSISGETVLVTAEKESSDSTGVNVDGSNDSAIWSGAGYVFVRSGTTWTQEAYLKASNTDRSDRFGEAGVISGDTILIGAEDEDNGIGCINGDESVNRSDSAGVAYVFQRTGTTWAQTSYLKSLTAHVRDYFGSSVAVEGNVAFVGAGNEDSNATGVNGDRSNNDASGSGAVYGFNLAALPVPFPSLCSGDGGDQLGCTDCPCMNNAPAGTVGGCLNSLGRSARLHACGNPSVSLPSGASVDLALFLTEVPPSTFCVLLSGGAVAPESMANPCFGSSSGAQAAAFDGLRCAVSNVRRHGGRSSNSFGHVGSSDNNNFPGSPWGGFSNPPAGIAQAGAGFIAGETRYFQVIHRENPLLSCMRGLNTSQAVEVTFTP